MNKPVPERQRTKARVIAAIESLTADGKGTTGRAVAERLGIQTNTAMKMIQALREQGVIAPRGRKGASVRLASPAEKPASLAVLLLAAMTADKRKFDVDKYADHMLGYREWCEQVGHDFRLSLMILTDAAMTEGRAA